MSGGWSRITRKASRHRLEGRGGGRHEWFPRLIIFGIGPAILLVIAAMSRTAH